jgi:hypothetical protein
LVRNKNREEENLGSEEIAKKGCPMVGKVTRRVRVKFS